LKYKNTLRGLKMKNGKYVILCIDDDQDVLDSLRIVLEHNDYIMVEAKTAEDGVKVYKAEKPDFVIVDLMMEEVDAGRNFAKEMQLLSNKAPIYMLSSVGDSLASNINFSELGLTGIFQKPVDFTTLISTLKSKLK
jgi:DNA-binding response OmpR family regulator